MIFALHEVLKTSACVTKNPKKAGDSSRYAGDREKGLKISRIPPHAVELTAMILVCATVQGEVFRLSSLEQGV